MYNNEFFSASTEFQSLISILYRIQAKKQPLFLAAGLLSFLSGIKNFKAAGGLFMTKLNARTSLLSLAVLVLLSSCGKSKELNTPTPATPQVAAPTMNTPNTQQPVTASEVEVNTNPNNDLLPDDGKRPVVVPKNNETKSGETVYEHTANSETKNQASQIDFLNQVALKTGGSAKELLYTGAGGGGLLEEFKSYGLKVNQQQQQKNSNLAKAISNARLTRLSSGQMQIDLVVDETINGQGGLKSYRLMATADGEGMKLNLSQSSGDLDFEGGFLKCLDTDGGCSHSYAKIKFSEAYTRIIFRNSFSNTHYLIQKDVSNNSAFDMLKTYVKNTSNGLDTNQKLDGLELASFEVINGRSAMGAMLTTKDQQMIGLSIPLLVSSKNSEVNVAVTKSTDLSKSFSLPSGLNYSQRLASGILEAKLINNNGLGQLKIKLNLGSGSIWMITSPVKKDLLKLEDVRQFESKLKNF